MKNIKLGVIGLGQRGYGMITDCLVHFDNVEVRAVCDLYADRVDRAADFLKENKGYEPYKTTDYKELLKARKLDAVYIATSWEAHAEVAVAAMKSKIPTALEVGGAYSLDECYALVRAYEETKTPFMFMENCCYNKEELLATAMAKAGKFGEIVFCSGAYGHDLREEISLGNIIRHYRLKNYTERNCENYPTHELGPIAMLLGINRTNKMVSLVSMATKSVGLKEYINKNELYLKDETLKDRTFMQGDIVTTLIKCENGEVIKLTLDTTLPRAYSREFTVRGTEGYYSMPANTVYLDSMAEAVRNNGEEWDSVKFAKAYTDNARQYEEEFLPDVWKNITEEDMKKGHGGMDYIMFSDFFDALSTGREMPINVYDAASWMCITCLSEKSIAEGGSVQLIPDFTVRNN